GGFDNDSRGGSSDGNKPRRNYDDQTLIPVTCRMIAQALGDPSDQGDLTLKDGRSLHMIKIVGAVREADLRSTNLFVQLEDGTGLMQVKVWINDGDDPSAISQLRQEACREHSYIRVIGQVREFDGSRQIVANDMRPVTDSNEVTYHFLEVAQSYEKMKKMQSGQASGMGFGIGNMASGGPPQGGGIKAAGQGLDGGKGAGNSLNDEVVNVIRGLGGESGAHVNEIVSQVSLKGFSEMDIRDAVTYLSNEGHIYSTIDEDHYQYAE
ncbi:hypothetical protein THAOC_02754, partial [Thalassiosira oceanica]